MRQDSLTDTGQKKFEVLGQLGRSGQALAEEACGLGPAIDDLHGRDAGDYVRQDEGYTTSLWNMVYSHGKRRRRRVRHLTILLAVT